MKKFLITMLSVLSMTPALAHHGLPHYSEPWHNINRPQFYPRHNHPQYGWGWIVPVLVGGVIVSYEWSRLQQPMIVQQQPVMPVPVTPNIEQCSDWREIQTQDGRVFRERVCRGN